MSKSVRLLFFHTSHCHCFHKSFTLQPALLFSVSFDSHVILIRSTYIMDCCIKGCRPLLFVGPTGTGKSAYVSSKMMHDLPQDQYIASIITFSAQSSANQTQVMVHF